ncbi:MAG: UbiA family prenyltransferase, partial [Paracoccaceae bacterium]
MSDAAIDPVLRAEAAAPEAGPRDFLLLLKPRVMSLVIFTAMVGMLAAPMGPGPVIGFAAILCIAAGAGAAGALNMWWDSDIDAVMKRLGRRDPPRRDRALRGAL